MIKDEHALAESHEHIRALEERNESLELQVAKLKRLLFGKKSERMIATESGSEQLWLGESFEDSMEPPARQGATIPVRAFTRKRERAAPTEEADQKGLRFDASVPVEDIYLPAPAEGEVIDVRITHVLAQKPAAYFIKRYHQPVVKTKEATLVTASSPPKVLERSFADMSFLVGILIDKIRYHLPLYRIHQRLGDGGITISRATLTNYVHRTAELLRPIYQALVQSVLQSRVLAMDETPIKAGRKKGGGEMQNSYFWVLYGDNDEIAFLHFPTRASLVIKNVLGEAFQGTLLTDQYAAYDKYVATAPGVTHALCWSHMRRKFFDALSYDSMRCTKALEFIRSIYEIEEKIRHESSEKRLEVRGSMMRAVVDTFFAWLEHEHSTATLLPSNPFMKAASYALQGKDAYRVVLDNPAVALDTNHLERGLRPVPMGKKNWLFCWTELGAEYVAILHTLIRSCILQGIEPGSYLQDVLVRIDTHPAHDVQNLIPRNWKKIFP